MSTENAEARLFRDASAAFVKASGSVPATRELWKQGLAFDRAWWAQAAEQGWTSLLVPEHLGGASASGEGVMDLVEVAELVGANASPGPLNVVSTVLAGLVHESAEGDHSDLIDALVAGEQIATWAVQAPRGGWNPEKPAVVATAVDAGWELTGAITAVEFGAEADLLLVIAGSDQGLLEVLVESKAAGVTITPTGSLDLVRPFADVQLEGVRVTTDAVVASGAAAAEVIAYQARIMNLLQVAEAVGVMGRVFDFTVQWGFDRFSFGRPLASYQALKHRYAHHSTSLQACRALVRAAARAVQEARPDAPKLVSAAKSYVGDKSVAVIQDCAQLHGGISQTMDHDIHVYLRRAVLDRMLYGTPREHREMVAALLIDGEVAA